MQAVSLHNRFDAQRVNVMWPLKADALIAAATKRDCYQVRAFKPAGTWQARLDNHSNGVLVSHL